MNDKILLREDQGPVAVLTLNRPEARNSLSEELIGALTSAVKEIGGSDALRAVIIAAEGPVFSAGHDLKEMTAHRADADGGRAYFAAIMARCAAMMQAIVQPAPAGDRRGGGRRHRRRLPLRGELRPRRRRCRGQVLHARRAISACSAPRPWFALSRNLSRKHAMEMLLLGEMVGAADAARFGLVNRVVAKGAALDEAGRLAATIAAKSPLDAAHRQARLLPARPRWASPRPTTHASGGDG